MIWMYFLLLNCKFFKVIVFLNCLKLIGFEVFKLVVYLMGVVSLMFNVLVC